MPIYEYRCAACGHHLEALQKMTESPLRKCPDCGKSQLRRLVSASRFRLKGSGWYETDFKDKNEKKRNLVDDAPVEAAEAPAKSETSETSSETPAAASKPAAAAETKPAPAKRSVAAKQAARRKPAAKPRAAKRSGS